MPSRREFLAALAAAPPATPRIQMAIATTCYLTVRRFRDTLEFLEHCQSLGAGGIQAPITDGTPDYLRRLRARLEHYGMWMEVITGMPKGPGDAAFRKSLEAARTVGALCVRSACLGGRRYETFSSAAEWKQFVAQSRAAIANGLKAAEAVQMPWALENHKDWTADEFVQLLGSYSSEYLGVCLDTGNNISLLDDPMEVIRKLAPYAISTHLKDMAVEEYADGFLLAETPLGTGMLDLAAITRIIRESRPKVKLTLEMITRDPLRIPCLTDRYWETFGDSGGKRLAATLRMVRKNRPEKPLPRLSALPASSHLDAEEQNVRECLRYARQHMAL